MPITKSSRQLVDEAMAVVRTYSVAQVRARLEDPATQIVDIRDIRELADGTVPGAIHAPRGMLEFWVDPESKYHKPSQSNNTASKRIVHPRMNKPVAHRHVFGCRRAFCCSRVSVGAPLPTHAA